jgi:hypothetical protein
MKSHIKVMILILVFLLTFSLPSFAKEKSGSERRGLAKTAAGQPYLLMNANNVTSWVHPDGFFNWLISQSWNGEFPRGSGVGTIFSEGIVFGGLVNDGKYSQTLRVTGNTYFTGMQAGAIQPDGTTDDKNATESRAFGVRPDMPPSIQGDSKLWPDLTVDAATFFQKPQASVTDGDRAQIAAQYFKDWTEWPASKGAPWSDDRDGSIRHDNAFDPNNPHHIPGIAGASKTIWFVCNDLNPTVSQTFAGSPPIGMEEQMTLWGYASSTPLNNIIFKQVKLIYKGNPGVPSTSNIDSMYVVQWADPDEGDGGGDFAGSDSTLNLNFVYNAATSDPKYAAIGLPAPAVGFVFLNGVAHYTGNFADSAVIDFQWRHGYGYWHTRPDPNNPGHIIPTPLTAAEYFASGTTISDPDNASYDGTKQWYNLMRGDLPRPAYPSGNPFYSSSTYASANNIVTPFVLSGDPVKGTGWIDGIDLTAGDRRLVTVHGPFQMKINDTAESVIALVDGMGTDNLTSVTALKFTTTFAARAFTNLFKLPAPPPAPQVSASELDKEIILNWGGSASSNATETTVNKSYAFEGYNVYQFPSASSTLKDAIKIATYDVVDTLKAILAPAIDPVSGATITVVVQSGTNSGIKRIQDITKDYIRNRPLINGQTYFFGVTAYSFNPIYNDTTNGNPDYAPSTPCLENSPTILALTPHITNPGTRFSAASGDVLPVQHTAVDAAKPLSDGSVNAHVIQPDKLTGHTYNVLFDTTGTTWTVKDVNTGAIVGTGTNQSGDANYPTFAGVQAVVQGPQPGMKQWSIPSGTRRFSPVGSGWAVSGGLGLEGFSSSADTTAYDQVNGTIGMAGHFAFGGIGTTLTDATKYHTVLLKLAAVDHTTLWDPLVAPADANFSKAYRYLRHANSPIADSTFTPWIINATAGYPYQDFNYGVPFSAWDESTTPPTRLAVGMFENNATGASVDGRYWPPLTTGDNSVNREFCFIFSAPYSTTPDPALAVNLSNNATTPLMWVMICNRRADVDWTSGDEFEIVAASVNGSNDIFSFVAPAPTYSATTAAADINKINVFPNPYYGMNTYETSRLNKYVEFNHLPTNATIRIFNLAGVLVRTLTKSDATSQFFKWDLRNEKSLPVASGIYIIHIDMPDIGKSKILKLALVQEVQILPTY